MRNIEAPVLDLPEEVQVNEVSPKKPVKIDNKEKSSVEFQEAINEVVNKKEKGVFKEDDEALEIQKEEDGFEIEAGLIDDVDKISKIIEEMSSEEKKLPNNDPKKWSLRSKIIIFEKRLDELDNEAETKLSVSAPEEEAVEISKPNVLEKISFGPPVEEEQPTRPLGYKNKVFKPLATSAKDISREISEKITLKKRAEKHIEKDKIKAEIEKKRLEREALEVLKTEEEKRLEEERLKREKRNKKAAQTRLINKNKKELNQAKLEMAELEKRRASGDDAKAEEVLNRIHDLEQNIRVLEVGEISNEEAEPLWQKAEEEMKRANIQKEKEAEPIIIEESNSESSLKVAPKSFAKSFGGFVRRLFRRK